MTSGIIEILIENAEVISLVGMSPITNKVKVFPTVIGEREEQPYIIVNQTSDDNETSLDKQFASLLDYPIVEIKCVDKSFRKSELLAQAVRGAIDNISATTDAGYNFGRIWRINHFEGYDQAAQVHVHVSTYKCELIQPGLS